MPRTVSSRRWRSREPFNSLTSYTYAIPFASLALVSVLLYGRNLALVLSLVFSLLVGLNAGEDSVWTMMLYTMASSLAAVHSLDAHQFKQRSAMTRASAVVGLVNAVALLALSALSGEVAGGMPQSDSISCVALPAGCWRLRSPRFRFRFSKACCRSLPRSS